MKTLDHFVRNALLEQGINVDSNYVRFLRITISVLNELNLHIIPNQETAILPVTDSLTAIVPKDFVSPTKVSKLVTLGGNRYCCPLRRGDQVLSKEIARFKKFLDCKKGDEVNTFIGINHIQIPFIFGYGEYYGYSADGTYAYYTVIDDKLVFEGNGFIRSGDEIIMQYKCIGTDAKKLIPTEAEPMVRHRALQRFYESTSTRMASYHESQFRIQIGMYRKFKLNVHTYDDYINAFQSNYSSAPR